jgi:hypothetical protein
LWGKKDGGATQADALYLGSSRIAALGIAAIDSTQLHPRAAVKPEPSS